ncbi:MAG: hypothetical protein OXF02_04700 [Simkaniaceae bacterium]|nr:hypothetical protein [Simkaniaceae bacterium]
MRCARDVANLWVILFVSVATTLYFRASRETERVKGVLREEIRLLEEEIREAVATRESLLFRLAGEGDPEWTALVLKEKLGVVEEGETKVLFLRKTPCGLR